MHFTCVYLREETCCLSKTEEKKFNFQVGTQNQNVFYLTGKYSTVYFWIQKITLGLSGLSEIKLMSVIMTPSQVFLAKMVLFFFCFTIVLLTKCLVFQIGTQFCAILQRTKTNPLQKALKSSLAASLVDKRRNRCVPNSLSAL